MFLLVLALFILTLPLGVAGQNLGAGLATLLALFTLWRHPSLASSALSPWTAKLAAFRTPIVLTLGFAAALTLSGTVNPSHPSGFGGYVLAGNLIWILLPPLMVLLSDHMTVESWQKLGSFLLAVVLCFGLVSLSQAIWGWRIEGSSLMGGTPRARGFYSHPLTLAYTILLVTPFCIDAVLREPRRLRSWLLAGGAFLTIFASQSRMVQLATLLVTAWLTMRYATPRARLYILAGGLAVATLIATTDNPVRFRLQQTLERDDVHTRDYPDDRFVFWEVHAAMIRERPILGHGDDLGRAYRKPYYEKLGYGDFPRQYEAHNQYLQLLTNGGIVGLALWGAWFLWQFRLSVWLSRRYPIARSLPPTLLAFAFAGLTQNGFQDAEVRYALALLCGAMWLAAAPLWGARPFEEKRASVNS